MKQSPDSLTVAEIIELIQKGKLALPEFQRNFIWKPSDVAELLRTAARQWPCGSFLLLEVGGAIQFAYKPLTSAPALREPEFLILDGQQRITSLYQAFTDNSPETYFIDMKGALAAGSFEDEHLQIEKKSRFVKKYPSTQSMAQAGVLKVSDARDDARFFEWSMFLPQAEQSLMVVLRQAELPGLKEYGIPTVKLKDDVPLQALAKIFETINKTGEVLDLRFDGRQALPAQLQIARQMGSGTRSPQGTHGVPSRCRSRRAQVDCLARAP